MVKIYISESLKYNIVNYVFIELFRYMDIDFEFVTDKNMADIIYSFESDIKDNQIFIKASKLFFNNYKNIKSLPATPLYKDADGLVYIYEEDIISSTFFLLTGYEEYLNPKRDKFDRFLYEFSYYKYDSIYLKPLVEEYRDKLISDLNSIGIQCKRKNIWRDKYFGLFLSHDVDGVYKYKNIWISIIKILLKPSKFSFSELIQSKKNIWNDPYFKGFEYLINTSNQYGFKSTFFFITKVREKLDNFYNISDKVIREVMQKIQESGFETGIHGTLQSFNSEKDLNEEQEIINNSIGVRQHYLKYDIRQTAQIQSKVFKYDSTLGFVDIIGFRRGTCMPFKVYDIEIDSTLNIFELPLNVMDQTLRGYMKLEPIKAYNQVVDLVKQIKNYNGLITLLWHPGNCGDEWECWIENVYEKLLKLLYEEGAQSLTGDEIIRRIEYDRKN